MSRKEEGFTLVEVLVSILITVLTIGMICTSLQTYSAVKKEQKLRKEAIRYGEGIMEYINIIYQQPEKYLKNLPTHYGVSIVAIPYKQFSKKGQMLKVNHLNSAIEVQYQNGVPLSAIRQMIVDKKLKYQVLTVVGTEAVAPDNVYLTVLTLNNPTAKEQVYYQMLGVKTIE